MFRRLAVLGCCLLTTAAFAAKEKSRVLVRDVSVLDTSTAAEAERSKRLGSIITENVASELSASGRVEVVTSSDLNAILGLERQRQLLGCDTEATSNCLAELTGALGAPLLVSG